MPFTQHFPCGASYEPGSHGRSWRLNPLLSTIRNIDPAGTSQFGLVAEDGEKVNPDLVARDKEGKPLQRALLSGERDVAQRVP